jgi:hypothetical protein
MSMSMPKPPILGLFCYGSVMTCSSEAVSSNFKDLHLISFRSRARVVSLAICCKTFGGLTECSGREVRRGAVDGRRPAKISCRFLADAANGFQPSPTVRCRRAAQVSRFAGADAVIE